VADPASALDTLRRPMPQRPYRASQRGTLFHSWVENRYGPGGSREVIDAFDGESEADDPIDAAELARLRATFEQSRWASLRPVEVEREIHLPFAGRIVICKLDAVYFEHGRYEVVDWKTGKAPRDAADLEQKQLQLALYRLAYSKWKKVDPSLIDAVFYYVGEDRVITPERIFDETELLTLWHLAGY
jgi:DNA helicase II / ATP-dependent DNA helicase PcrA